MGSYPHLRGRRAVVTGAARGIGFAIAQRLLEEHASVVIVDIDSNALASAYDIMAAAHTDHVLSSHCDISDPKAVRHLRQQVQGYYGGVDILVNNAAILDSTAFEDLTEDRLLEVLRVNLLGAINCIQALLPELSASHNARIVNVSSINGLRGTSSSVAYNAAKAALISLTQSLAAELSSRHISINAVAPGFVDTRMSKLPDGRSEYDTPWFKDVYLKHGRLPLGRPAVPADIADPVVFLCSDDARYVNGQVLVVDGGVTATL